MIVSGGESLIDFIQLPGANAGSGRNPIFEAAPGGGPYNCALAVARLGAPSGFLGPLSDGSLGQLLADRLNETGASLLITDRSNAETSLAIVSVDESGKASYRFYRNGTADRDVTVPKLLNAVPDDASIFLTGTLALTQEEDATVWTELAGQLDEKGTMIALDPNLRTPFITDWDWYRKNMARMFDLATIVKASDEDLEALDISPDIATIRSRLVESHGCALVALTQGANGATLIARDTEISVPVFTPEIFGDTVGAGDTFIGGLLSEIYRLNCKTSADVAGLSRETLAEIGTFASVAAGLNCAENGRNPPSRQKVLDTISRL